GEELRADPEYGPNILEPTDIMGLDRFEDSAVVVRARLKTAPGHQWAIKREYNRRLKAAFDERGIEMPFPHQTIYFGEDKEGRAPSAFINIEDAKKSAPRAEHPGKNRKPVLAARKSSASTGEDDGGNGGDGC
ncbi:MAG: mechanosensitive ion channel family protein, partial [Alphaproteobacteria bacterium]